MHSHIFTNLYISISLRSYFRQFKFTSISSETFQKYFLGYFSSLPPPGVEAVDWATWLHSPGPPPFRPDYDTSLADDSRRLAERWQAQDIGK